MRNKFVQLLIEWAREDENIFLLTGDLGFSVLEPFRNEFPDRFINVGISEQNMIGVATGLAKRGKRVFVYSIVNFATLRCLEQIRNDVCYHNANVVITIVGGGFAYGTHGYTHLGLEDVAAMMPLPNMKIFSPADAFELEGCMHYIKNSNGPCYLRMARGGEPNLHPCAINLSQDLLKAPYPKINLISHGPVFSELLVAQKQLKEAYQLDVGVYSLPLLKPIPDKALNALLQASSHVFVFEEHMEFGGLSSVIASLAAPLHQRPYIYSRGANEKLMHTIGKQAYMRQIVGLDANSIVNYVVSNINS